MSSRAWLKRGAALIILIAAALYIAYTVRSNWSELRSHHWEFRPGLLVVSTLAHVAVLAWGVAVWRQVLAGFGRRDLSLPMLQRIWFLSNLARYIPGKIFQFLAAAQLGRDAGFTGSMMVGSLLVHTGFSLVAAVLVSAVTLQSVLLPGVPPVLVSGLAAALAFIAVSPPVLRASLGLVARLFRRPFGVWHGSWMGSVGLLALSVLSWALYGGAYHLLVVSVTEMPARALPVLTGVNAFSFVIGYAAFFTSGGLGVREVVMARLLEGAGAGAGVAAVLAVLARLWTIAAELLGGAAAVLWARYHRQPATADT